MRLRGAQGLGPSFAGLLLTVSSPAALTAAAPAPAEFQPNTRVGPGGTRFKDYPHFRVYAAPNESVADTCGRQLEAAYSCFVGDLGWRSTGLSFRQETDDGPFYKLNVYRVDDLPGAAANTGTDMKEGLAFLNVVTRYLAEPSVTVHEFGHAMTYAAHWWIDQGRTGAWWETVANFVADTYLTSPLCGPARARYGQAEGSTLADLKKVIGDSHQVIVDGTRNTGNYYQAWPFLVYLFHNPDNVTGLGTTIFPNVWTRYKRNSNETPLHVLDRLASAGGARIQDVVARYWARMAFVDIGHAKMQALFASQRRDLKYPNLDAVAGGGAGRYRPKPARQPRYMGANIIPLKAAAGATVAVNVTAAAPFSAALAVRAAGGGVRYVELPKGAGQTTVAGGEEAMLVVVNTPATLYLYDPFSLTREVSQGLDYQLQLTGATA